VGGMAGGGSPGSRAAARAVEMDVCRLICYAQLRVQGDGPRLIARWPFFAGVDAPSLAVDASRRGPLCENRMRQTAPFIADANAASLHPMMILMTSRADGA